MGQPAVDQRVTNGITKSTTYTYNLSGTLATITYPVSGRMITYAAGTADRPLSASDVGNSINYLTNAYYSPAGSLCSGVFGSSITATNTFNKRLQPVEIQSTTTGAPPTPCNAPTQTGNILDVSYSFNLAAGDNGNVISIANNRDTTRTESFGYDSLNRLSTAQTSSTFSTSPSHCWGELFGYDQWANLLQIAVSSSSYNGCTQENFNMSVNLQNQLSSSLGYQYDAAGNLTAQTSPSSASYTYNAEGQMTSTAGVTYTYDGDGKRTIKSNGKLYWFGMGTDALDETDLSGNLTNEYVFFGGERIARRDSGNNIYYYFEDHLGTSRVITNVSGSPCYDADFYPFGGERSAYVNTCSQNYKFTSKERDVESGLDDFDARYYTSNLGRFMTPDWSATPEPIPYAHVANPQSLNLYSYLLDSPINTADKDGHCRVCPDGMAPEEKTRLAHASSKELMIAMLIGVGSAAAPAALEGGAIASVFAYGRALIATGIGYFMTPQGQQTAQNIGEAVSPPGANLSMASTFGIAKVEGSIEGFIYGRLANGAEVAAKFSKSGDNVTAGVFGAFNQDASKGAGTLSAVVSGARAVAKELGASSVTIQAIAPNKSLAALLTKRGFTETTVKIGTETVKALQKTYQVP